MAVNFLDKVAALIGYIGATSAVDNNSSGQVARSSDHSAGRMNSGSPVVGEPMQPTTLAKGIMLRCAKSEIRIWRRVREAL